MANPWPTITFRVNLETVNRYDWLQPYFNTEPVGNETEPEGDNFKFTRSSWSPGLTLTNINEKQNFEFTEYGLKAIYLKNTYTTGDDPLLEIVSA